MLVEDAPATSERASKQLVREEKLGEQHQCFWFPIDPKKRIVEELFSDGAKNRAMKPGRRWSPTVSATDQRRSPA
jgi:hypothetical protein